MRSASGWDGRPPTRRAQGVIMKTRSWIARAGSPFLGAALVACAAAPPSEPEGSRTQHLESCEMMQVGFFRVCAPGQTENSRLKCPQGTIDQLYATQKHWCNQ